MTNTSAKKRNENVEVLLAAFANILSWFVSKFFPSLLPMLLPSSPEEESDETAELRNRTKCISIGRPGGLEQLRFVTLREGIPTIGYNVRHVGAPPYAPPNCDIPSDCVMLKNEAFSVNYADCCI